MVISFRNIKYILLLIMVIAIIVACSEKKEPESVQTTTKTFVVSDTTYQNWKSYAYKHITIMYPEDYDESSLISDIANKYDAIIRNDCQFLNMPVPQDSLTIFMFNAVNDGRTATEEMFPFFRGDSIFYWPPYTYGVAVGEYLIAKWAKAETRFHFMNQGLVRLFDASGRNFHLLTLDFIDSSMFRSLNELAVDSTINANIERHRSVLSASFVDFVAFKYSASHLALLYHSPKSFDSSVADIFQITTDSLEKEWIETIRNVFKR